MNTYLKKKRKNVAIIGSGISGLSTAYMLDPYHNITVFEKNDYLGGHSRTIDVATPSGNIAVDTGFIVFNYDNYPLLSSLFTHLQVPVQKSNMSFAASIQNGWLEYGTQSLANIFSQKSNIFRIQFWGMLFDILNFNRTAIRYINAPPSFTLGQCLNELNMGQWFRQYYLCALGGAIWSTPLSQILHFPAQTFIRFFTNHGLLRLHNQPTWYTVAGGSREYIKLLTATYKDNILLECGVHKVIRKPTSVTLIDTHGRRHIFDEVVFACHADQALAIIDCPTTAEQAVLSQIHYQPNRMVLHSDERFMPKRESAWASWVYLSGSRKYAQARVSLSYWMNNLQSLDTNVPLIVTLNPGREPDATKIHDQYWFDHPKFDEHAITAQEKIPDIQGKNRLWFCGAYQHYGFHEDGLRSAVNVAKQMGVSPQWI